MQEKFKDSLILGIPKKGSMISDLQLNTEESMQYSEITCVEILNSKESLGIKFWIINVHFNWKLMVWKIMS